MKNTDKKISELISYEKNIKTHPQKQIDLLAKNIEKFGFTTPILIDKNNTVIAGHGRLLAMKQLNKDEIPCVLIDYLNNKEIKALRLADNQITAMSEWDMGLVIDELKGLDDDLQELTGIDLDIEDIDFDNINDTSDRKKQFKDMTIVCPNCNKTFVIKV